MARNNGTIRFGSNKFQDNIIYLNDEFNLVVHPEADQIKLGFKSSVDKEWKIVIPNENIDEILDITKILWFKKLPKPEKGWEVPIEYLAKGTIDGEYFTLKYNIVNASNMVDIDYSVDLHEPEGVVHAINYETWDGILNEDKG